MKELAIYLGIGLIVLIWKVIIDKLVFKRNFVKETGEAVLERGVVLPSRLYTPVGLAVMWLLHPLVFIGSIYQLLLKLSKKKKQETKPAVIVPPEKKLIRHEHPEKQGTMHAYINILRAEMKVGGRARVADKLVRTIRGDMESHARKQMRQLERTQSLEEVMQIYHSDPEWHSFCVEMGITDDLVIKWYKEFRSKGG